MFPISPAFLCMKSVSFICTNQVIQHITKQFHDVTQGSLPPNSELLQPKSWFYLSRYQQYEVSPQPRAQQSTLRKTENGSASVSIDIIEMCRAVTLGTIIASVLPAHLHSLKQLFMKSLCVHPKLNLLKAIAVI